MQHVLEVLDAFLEYMRAAAPLPSGADDTIRTRVFNDPTRETNLPATLAATMKPFPGEPSNREERTVRERVPGTEEARPRRLASVPPVPPPRVSYSVQTEVAESSIIVDESITQEQEEPTVARRRPTEPSGPGEFLAEMKVLLKYGHAEQVRQEVQRWFVAHPDDLEGWLDVIEFEMAYIDSTVALERLFSLAGRALDRREIAVARQVYDRVRALAPTDLRVHALRERLER